MRNLKRALSLTLASVMLLGMMIVGSSAASFNDADDIENVTAATILQELKIMQGSNGNFAPNETVTRGQMAIIICKMLYGDKLSVSQFADTQQFDDVPAGQYYTGYVNLASNLGIISGYGNGSFGPGDPITTAQAALMLTRALGYYQNNELSGQGWAANALTATTLATRLDIFNGLNLGVNDPLSRDNVSAMTFNTLTRATPVKFNSVLNEYYTDGGPVTGGVDYIDAYEYGTRLNNTLGYTVYGMYITNRSDRDDFNRPADEWSYEKGGVIGSFNDEPIAVFTAKVTSKKLYDTIGKTAVDSYSDFNFSLNGVTITDYDRSDLNDNKNDDNDDFYKEETGKDDLTGNGVITEVYVNGADRRVDVVVIDTYAAEVYSVKDGKITLADLIAGPAKTTDEFEATGFAEDDVVVYTYANGKIQSVYAADKVEGEVTRVRANSTDSNGDNFNVDSQTYSYNRNMTKDRLTTDNVDNNVVAYTDANGYVVYIDEAAATYEYAYLLTANADPDVYGGGETVYARLVMTDGTIKKVQTDADKGELETTTVSGGVTTVNTHNMIASYSVNKNNVYTLTRRDGASSTTSGTNGLIPVTNTTIDIFKNGRAIIETGRNVGGSNETYTANSNTILIVGNSENNADDYTFTVYTGVNNIPDIKAKATGKTTQIDVAANEKGVAKVVYIQDADVSGVGGVIYIRADYEGKLVHATGDNRYYEINAVVDGKLETLKVKQDSDAAKILVNKGVSSATPVGDDATVSKINVKAQNGDKTAGQWIVAAKSLTIDGNDMVTNVKFFDINASNAGTGEDGSFSGTATLAAKNSVVTLGGRSYPWSSSVDAVRYNVKSGSFSVSTIGSIKDDTNDDYVAVTDDYSLTGVCIIEREGGAGSGSNNNNPDTPIPGTNEKLPSGSINSGKIVIKYYKEVPSNDKILEIASNLAGDEATRVNLVSNKVFFGQNDASGVDLVLTEQVAVKIGSTTIGYVEKDKAAAQPVGSGLTNGKCYLPANVKAASYNSSEALNTGLKVAAGKLTIPASAATADITLVEAHALTIDTNQVDLSYMNNSTKTAITTGQYVQDGTVVTITGKLATGYSRLTQKVGAADATYLEGSQDGKDLTTGKNTATITVSQDVTLGEVAALKIVAPGITSGTFAANGGTVEFTSTAKHFFVKGASGADLVSGTDIEASTAASGKVSPKAGAANTWVYTVDSSQDANSDGIIEIVAGAVIKSTNSSADVTFKTDATSSVAVTGGKVVALGTKLVAEANDAQDNEMIFIKTATSNITTGITTPVLGDSTGTTKASGKYTVGQTDDTVEFTTIAILPVLAGSDTATEAGAVTIKVTSGTQAGLTYQLFKKGETTALASYTPTAEQVTASNDLSFSVTGGLTAGSTDFVVKCTVNGVTATSADITIVVA